MIRVRRTPAAPVPGVRLVFAGVPARVLAAWSEVLGELVTAHRLDEGDEIPAPPLVPTGLVATPPCARGELLTGRHWDQVVVLGPVDPAALTGSTGPVLLLLGRSGPGALGRAPAGAPRYAVRRLPCPPEGLVTAGSPVPGALQETFGVDPPRPRPDPPTRHREEAAP